MTIADSISPREAVRAALRERFRDLINGATQRIDVDAPLDPDAPGELDEKGEPAKLWQNVPVITVKDFEAAFDTTFGEKLPPPSEHTAEAATPALVIISAVCPRCQMPARIPLAVDVELHQDRDGETLHLKAKSKEAIHTCGQMELPEGEEPDQTSFGLDDIIGPVPTADELASLLNTAVYDEIPLNHQPNLERTKFAAIVEGWNDATRREVAAWATAVRVVDLGTDEASTEIPPLPFVLGGAEPEPVETRDCPACGAAMGPDDTHWSIFPEPMGGYVCPDGQPHDPQPTAEDMDAEADLGSEDELCPYKACELPADHEGDHNPPADDDLLPV